jgi:hypothetical protein
MDAFNAMILSRRVRAEKKFSFGFNLIPPVQSLSQKINPFPLTPNQIHISSHPTPLEGRIAIVTDAGRDAMDAGGAFDESAGCGRRSRVVLTPRRWRQVCGGNFAGDGNNKARSPGRARRKPLKPLRREGRVSRRTCGDELGCFLHLAHEAAGATGTRLSLRPLCWADGSCTTRAHRAARSRMCI